MSNSTIITMIGCLLLILFGFSKSASNKRCLPISETESFCFIKPDPLLALTWSSAMEYCGNIGATLPITSVDGHHGVYQNALKYFGMQNETLWMGAKAIYDPNNWSWLNGSSFTGTVTGSLSPSKTHAYIARNETYFAYVAASPFEPITCLCLDTYSEIECARSRDSYWTNGKCYKTGYITWYSRDIYWCRTPNHTSFEELQELSGWLNDLVKNWVDLRCGWWTWQNIVTGRSFEMDDYGSDSMKISAGRCAASDSMGRMFSNDCSKSQKFVCQQYIDKNSTPETAVTTPKSTYASDAVPKTRTTVWDNINPTARTSATGFTGEQIRDCREFESSNDHRPSVPMVLVIFLGVQYLVVIWLMLLTIHSCRRNRGATYSLTDLQKESEKNSKAACSNAYDNCALNVVSETVEMKAVCSPY